MRCVSCRRGGCRSGLVGCSRHCHQHCRVIERGSLSSAADPSQGQGFVDCSWKIKIHVGKKVLRRCWEVGGRRQEGGKVGRQVGWQVGWQGKKGLGKGIKEGQVKISEPGVGQIAARRLLYMSETDAVISCRSFRLSLSLPRPLLTAPGYPGMPRRRNFTRPLPSRPIIVPSVV